jgi:hypothetical protein
MQTNDFGCGMMESIQGGTSVVLAINNIHLLQKRSEIRLLFLKYLSGVKTTCCPSMLAQPQWPLHIANLLRILKF